MGLLRIDEPLPNHKNAIAVGSRVSVETQEYVATGVVTYVEGDILEIEFPQYKHYNLGDEVKITVYSANGFLILHSSIIVKDFGFVMVINPKENQKLVQKREHPRVNVELSGLLHGVTSTAASNKNSAPPVPISIQNVSIGGIGFLIDAEHHIRPSMFLDVELKLGSGISCQLQVIRRSMSDKGAFIGTQFTQISNEHLTMLRGFILRNQVNVRINDRKEAQKAI